LQQLIPATSTGPQVTEEEMKILTLLSDAQYGLEFRQIADEIKMKRSKVDYHMGRLNQMRFIDVRDHLPGLESADIRQEGRELLVKSGML
jgi:DNA-binding MarR family transcriptional regulator